MSFKHTYSIRPGYGSTELLIELQSKKHSNELIDDLVRILLPAGFAVGKTEDLWVNDEEWIQLSSKHGGTTISRDIWNLFFIMGENGNQEDILIIDLLLEGSDLFEKILLDFSKFS